MEGYRPVLSFGADTAATYDLGVRGDEAETVEFLSRLAAGGRALELAIGTGRIALPLAERGVAVDGVDLSPAMIEKLRAKPGGSALAVTIGDFADVPVPGSYRLVYVVYNTFYNLLTQDDQVRCFQNVASHLDAPGAFVIEGFSPSYLHRLHEDQYVNAEALRVDEVVLDVARHDPVRQVLEESHVSLSPRGVRLNPIVCRYAWPSELDLMARLAGLRLRERWGGWDRRPFTASSRNCVSVYGR